MSMPGASRSQGPPPPFQPGRPGGPTGPGGPGGPTGPPPSGRGSKPPKKPKGDTPVTRRVISTNRIFAIMLAVAVAVLLALLLVFSSPTPDFYVVRSTSPIPAASPLEASQLEAIKMDDEYIEQGAFKDKDAKKAIDKAIDFAAGQTVQFPISKRQQITKTMFASEVSLGTPLAPDERLVSVRASAASAAAGTLRVGDSVDVVAFDGTLAGMVASNVEVVAITVGESQLTSAAGDQLSEANIDKSAVDLLPSDPIPGVFLLRVQMHQLTPIAVADANADGGRTYLVARGTAAENYATAPITVLSAICGKALTPEDLGPPASGTTVQLPEECLAAGDVFAPVEPVESTEPTEAPG